uniref:RNB domain-containing protein n=1 Tax=viral metagenome TaxID=1070528 RepID=A0A6C0EUL7_9ZZZZ
MTTYKVHINNRDYASWTFYNATDFQEIELPINPIENKLFANDIFTLDDDETSLKKVNIVHSTIRISSSIPGVLIINDNKTYGRHKNGKLLYKCVPDDMRIPTFLVPYEIKNMGFSKVFENIYVTFNFMEWQDKHPLGLLAQVIGSVDIIDNFYEYQLYCKSLNSSIQKFNKDTTNALKLASHDAFIETICDKYTCIEDRTKWSVFTIDPPHSLDFDDGFSIKALENGQHQLSIYISNVTIWMDVLNLWDSFSRRISTIYLPDRKRPMLPTILSDCLCSLQSNNLRIAFVMDLFIDANDEIVDITYSNSKIKVYRNYSYEEPALLSNPNYMLLMNVTKTLCKKYKYINSVRNSHDLVSYLMILMNFHSAKSLLSHKNGIFRSTIMKRDISIPDHLPEEVCKFIKIWNSSAGQYIDVNALNVGQTINHDHLDMDAYVHITSPIRRLVDLLNIIKFQQNTGMITLSESSALFYDKWIADLEYINTTMRSIRRVQNDCSLLHLCSTSPGVMEKTHEGYAFDKIIRNDGLYQVIVYLPALKLTSRIIMRENIENYDMHQYKLYLFHNEEKFKKKIRLQIQTPSTMLCMTTEYNQKTS